MRNSLPILAAVLVLAGCQKVNVTKTYEMAPFAIQSVALDAPRSAQDVRATLDPEGGAVSAYLVTTENASAVQSVLQNEKTPAPEQLLASKTNRATDPPQQIVLEAKVPAKTGYTLLIQSGAKAATVKVNVVGK